MKRVLFVTYYFPPSGGPGVQRSLKFIKFLPQFGWEPTVLTVDPEFAAYPNLDPGLNVDIPDEIRVVRTRARDPYAAYARMMGRKKRDAVGVGFLSHARPGIREMAARWIRANFYLPDARVGWVPFARRAARNLIGEVDFDAVISTGPPHSTHLVAETVKQGSGAAWIIDVRDAWPDDSYAHMLPMSGWARARDARRRNGIYRAADRLVVISDSLKRSAAAQTDTPIEIISNGFDEQDFETAVPVSNESFTIVYAGNMSDERNPEALWSALSRRKSDWRDCRVRLIGNVAGSVHESIRAAGLQETVEFMPYVSHSTAVSQMCGAHVLLLPVNRVPGAAGIVTGKIFEYLGAGRPILCLAPPVGDAAAIIDECDAGRTHDFEDVEGVEESLATMYDAWKRGERLQGATRATALNYSRKLQTRRLSDILNQLTHH